MSRSVLVDGGPGAVVWWDEEEEESKLEKELTARWDVNTNAEIADRGALEEE